MLARLVTLLVPLAINREKGGYPLPPQKKEKCEDPPFMESPRILSCVVAIS